MRNTGKAKSVFYFSILLVMALVTYKIYLNFFEQDFESVHARQVERIEANLEGKASYRFAVVGNINNSVGIFERKIIPMLNESDVDFVVSSGNAVSSGGEDKYRALYRTLGRLEMPYLLTFGENEYSRLGGFRFYDHFGPWLFSFSAGNSRFVFLDSTGNTDFKWQSRWLEEELSATTGRHAFIFSGHPLKSVDRTGLLELDDDYLFPDEYRSHFTGLIERFNVDAVFSTNLPVFSRQQYEDTQYVLTGGGGGLVLNNSLSYYHYVVVEVDGQDVNISPVRLDIGQHPFWRTLESLWFFIHSLFYVGYLNFLLLVSALVAIILWLRSTLLIDRDYYPNFDLDPEPFLHHSFRVAQFTNNFLPFIGGVPISVDRLRRGLQHLGHTVLIIAPAYRREREDEPDTLRVRSLLPLGEKNEFRLANIFSPRLYRTVIDFKPDLIHVHHPFWLGSVGLFLARRLGVPAVYTYHTRLEHYSHYVPLPGPLFRNLISHALVRHFANRCDGVVVPTESAEEYLRMVGVKRPVFVQPTGIDYTRFESVDQDAIEKLRAQHGLGDEKILISVSRLSKEKNIDFMLDGIHDLIQRDHEPFKLLIIGDGPERDRLQASIANLGLENYVLLPGGVAPEEIPLYCQLGDIFVFASRSETQGMVILEAMAAGLPVVVVRSSGIDDVVRDGHNGFKMPLDRSRWRERVQELLHDSTLRSQLSSNAQEFARSFRIEQYGENMARIYALVLATRASNDAGEIDR